MGDILLVNFVYSSSVQSKKRPALVILDINDADIILAPITTKERPGKLTDYDKYVISEIWHKLYLFI